MQRIFSVEGIDIEETFSTVARMEEIRMTLAYAFSKRIKVYQMDIKVAFLNGELEHEVYIEKPEEFILSKHGDYVFRLKNAMYGINKTAIAWY